MTHVIEATDVKKVFGRGEAALTVLDGASFTVEKGEFVSLMGPSGSGKSTLLYLIGGLDRDYGGTIRVCGEDIGKMKEAALSRLRLERIGFVFQFYNLVQNLSIEDNLLLPQRARGRKRSELEPLAAEILEITGLAEKRRALPNQLSGGQQQRAAIARAVLGSPEIILADEPTGNLDSRAGGEIMALFRRINAEKGITVLQVTHSQACADCGSRIVRIENGRTA